MIQILNLASADEWFEIAPLSAVLVDVGTIVTSEVFINRLVSCQPSVVSFFGQCSEAWHDAFDLALVLESLESVTTWHDDESASEVMWNFLNVYVPLFSSKDNSYLICIGSRQFLEELKERN